MVYQLKYNYFYRIQKSLFYGNKESGYREMVIRVEARNELEAIEIGYTILLNYKSKHDGDAFVFYNAKELRDNKFIGFVGVEESPIIPKSS